MDIMPASVHNAVMAGFAGNLIGFLNGQSIHIRPQADGEALLFPIDGGNHTAPAEFSRIGNAHFVQFPVNHRQRLGQVKADFGIHMNLFPQRLGIRRIVEHQISSLFCAR